MPISNLKVKPIQTFLRGKSITQRCMAIHSSLHGQLIAHYPLISKPFLLTFTRKGYILVKFFEDFQNPLSTVFIVVKNTKESLQKIYQRTETLNKQLASCSSESSFNMAKGGGGGGGEDEEIDGGLQKFLDTQKGGSEKIGGGGKLQKFVYF